MRSLAVLLICWDERCTYPDNYVVPARILLMAPFFCLWNRQAVAFIRHTVFCYFVYPLHENGPIFATVTLIT